MRQTVLGLQTASLDVTLDLLAGVVAAIDFGLKCLEEAGCSEVLSSEMQSICITTPPPSLAMAYRNFVKHKPC
jgi:hypothetical protein